MSNVTPWPRSSHLLFKVIDNSATLIAGEFFYRFSNFLASILVARTLGTERYGQFSFIYVYVSFFEAFVQFGMNPILVRTLSQSRKKTPQILGNAILLRIALVLGAMPVAFWAIQALGYPLTVRQGVFLAYFQLFLTLRPIFETVFRINLLMIYPVLWNGLRALTNLLLITLVAFFHPALPWFISAYLISGLIGLASLAFFSRRYFSIDFRLDRTLLSQLVRESAPLLVSAYLTIIYYRVDIFMLSSMKGFSEVGLYSTATRITETLTVISNSIFASFFPLISQAFKTDPASLREWVSKGFQALLLLGFPIAIGGTLVGKELIPFLFGPAYASAGGTLVILCWHTFFVFQGGLLANVLIGCGRQIVDMWISLLLVFVNIGLNLSLIPSFSSRGAAVATLLTEALGFVIYAVFTARDSKIQISLPWEELKQALKINVPFFLLLFLLKKFFSPPPLLMIAGGGVLYGILLLCFGMISWERLKRYLAFSRSGAVP